MEILVHLYNLVDYLQHHQDVLHIIFEVVLILLIANLLYQKAWDPRKKDIGLTREQAEQVISQWEPEEWEKLSNEQMKLLETPVVTRYNGTSLTANGIDAVNFATSNFSGLSDDKEVLDIALNTLKTRGPGSCGPRGFYGTVDTHIQLEDKLGQFMGTDAAIVYSSSYSSVASVIPAFVKRGDVVVVDKSSNLPILEGCRLSRGKILYYKHNDLEDLEAQLISVTKKDKGKPVKNRRFIIFEAISQRFGDIAPLDKILKLQEKYRFRTMVDEANSIGVLGESGCGITEHYGLPSTVIDVIMGCLGRSIPAAGGFCVGRTVIIDHQRLSAPGYVFSASLSPYLCTAAIKALDLLMTKKKSIFPSLKANCKTFRSSLASSCDRIQIWGDAESPIVPITIRPEYLSISNDSDLELLVKEITDELLEKHHIAVARDRHTLNKREFHHLSDKKKEEDDMIEGTIPHCMRVYISAKHTKKEIKEAVEAITTVVNSRTDPHTEHYSPPKTRRRTRKR